MVTIDSVSEVTASRPADRIGTPLAISGRIVSA
jgi:hypothetical protein